MAEPQVQEPPDAAPPHTGGGIDSILKQAADTLLPEAKKLGEAKEAFAGKVDATATTTRGIGDDLKATYAQRDKLSDEYAASLKQFAPPPAPQFQGTEPLQAFGSFATILGALGGLLTRQPLTASLNAAAGAMTAIKSRDLQTFDTKLKEWKAHSEHASRLLDWQNRRYAAIMERYDRKPQDAMTAIRIEAAALGQDQIALAAREGRLDVVQKALKDVFDMSEKLKTSGLAAAQFAETKRHALVTEKEIARYHDQIAARPVGGRGSGELAAVAEAVKRAEAAKAASLGVQPDAAEARLTEEEYNTVAARTMTALAAGKRSVAETQAAGRRDVALIGADARAAVAETNAASRAEVANVNAASRENVAQTNADSRTQAAEIRAQSQRDVADIKAETAGDRLDFDYDKLKQGRWATEQKNKLIRLGLTERAAEAEMRERIAAAKIEADRYKTDKSFDAKVTGINAAHEVGMDRNAATRERIEATSAWKAEDQRIKELGLSQAAEKALRDARLKGLAEETKRYIADNQRASRDYQTDRRFDASTINGRLRAETATNIAEMKDEEFWATQAGKDLDRELKTRIADDKERETVRKAVFREMQEENRHAVDLEKLGQGEMKLELARTAQELKGADSAEKRSQSWAKLAQYDRRLDQFDRKLEQGDVVNEVKKMGVAQKERQIDLVEEKLKNTKEYQDAVIGLKERNLDETQIRDQMRFRIAEWVNNAKGAHEDRVDARVKAKVDGVSRIDQAIVNDLANYPGLKKEDLGYIPPAQQTKVVQARHAAKNLEDIGEFVVKHPETTGLIAEIQKRINLDSLQSLFSSNSPQAINAALDREVEKATKAVTKGDVTTAARVKELNKMLVTQAFIDAATSGQRPSVYLDKVFREVYQQNSSPTTLIAILGRRYTDANKVLDDYKMGFSERTDKRNFPLWNTGAEGYQNLVRASEDARAKGKSIEVVHGESDFAKVKPGDGFIYIAPDTGQATYRTRNR